MSYPRVFLTLPVLVVWLAACDRAGPLAVEPAGPAYAAAVAQEHQILAEIRKGTARFHRVEVAVSEGYIPVSPCVASPLGGMGYHYLKPALMDGVVDPSAPEILLYQPTANGRLELVGVEFSVPPAAWTEPDPPHLGEQPFGFDPFGNYALHVWVWRHNPLGMYAGFNPNVSCEHAP